MLRRLLTSVLENTLHPESTVYPCPFTTPYLSHLSWLTSVSPCFPVKSSNIKILTEPSQFYDTLIKNCQEATQRITLVSLYIGNGSLEHKLVDSLLNNTSFVQGDLKLNILLDYTRGSRYKNNSRVFLKPVLLTRDDDNCQVSLYHTPVLRGLRKMLAPNRWNELFGLQHMKLYIFDDTLVISGANLSNDYFTNRQDRYFVIKDKPLCDFYDGLVKKVQKFSLRMDKNNNLSLNEGWRQLPYEGRKIDFVYKAGDVVENYLNEQKDERNICKREGFDTWIFPLVQMGQLGIEQDASVTTRLLAEAPKDSQLFIATGYFNLTRQYMNTIVKNSCKCNLLMAHPNANGFQGASFPSGGIPAAYSLIAQRFIKNLVKLGHSSRVNLQEYLREGWTYHAKGLWYYPPNHSTPTLTLIGSPNFGERSVKRDLETQLAIVTENTELREELHKECTRLYKLGLPLDQDRPIPKWVYPMVFFFRGYF